MKVMNSSLVSGFDTFFRSGQSTTRPQYQGLFPRNWEEALTFHFRKFKCVFWPNWEKKICNIWLNKNSVTNTNAPSINLGATDLDLVRLTEPTRKIDSFFTFEP